MSFPLLHNIPISYMRGSSLQAMFRGNPVFFIDVTTWKIEVSTSHIQNTYSILMFYGGGGGGFYGNPRRELDRDVELLN